MKPFFDHSRYPANSDYFPVLDENAQRASFRQDNSNELRAARDSLVPVLALLDGETRTPLSRIARAGINRPIRVDRALAGAEAIGVFITGKAEDSRILDARSRATALLAHSLLGNCAAVPREWADAFTDVVELASPFLARDDVKVAFETARGSRCWASLGETERLRVQLLEAINDRDAARMAQHATALLGRPTDPRVARVAFTSAIAALASLGRLDEARALWDRNVALAATNGRLDFVTRLLYFHIALR